MKKLNQNGSHVIAIIVAIAVAGFIGFAGYKVISKSKQSKNDKTQASDSQTQVNAKKDCKGNGPVTLTHAPMDMSDVGTVLPVGTLAGAHVTPIDHMYFYPKDMTNRDAAPVYAMGDGFITEYGERTQKVDNGAAQKAEYQLRFQHNCDIETYFDLLTSLDPAIDKQIKATGGKDLHIAVKSGQVVGRVGAQSLDTGVYNYAMSLKGFVNPDSYKGEAWKIHTDDLFKYFKDPIRSQILAKNVRKVEPYGGKIDYDVAGKLVGNWFVEGSGGYSGVGQRVGDGSGKGYWTTHFSIAPDAIDPTTIDVSFGDYLGQPKQFAAKNGSADPATIGTSNGVVKYELVAYKVPSPSPTGGVMVSSQQVVGVALFQVLDGNKMKMEVFPDKTASQVSAFTSSAKTYER